MRTLFKALPFFVCAMGLALTACDRKSDNNESSSGSAPTLTVFSDGERTGQAFTYSYRYAVAELYVTESDMHSSASQISCSYNAELKIQPIARGRVDVRSGYSPSKGSELLSVKYWTKVQGGGALTTVANGSYLICVFNSKGDTVVAETVGPGEWSVNKDPATGSGSSTVYRGSVFDEKH